jgi:hypothetical protein
MESRTVGSRITRYLGFLILACWLPLTINHVIDITRNGVNVGVGIANTALLLLAIIAFSISFCFRQLEQKLSMLEEPGSANR